MFASQFAERMYLAIVLSIGAIPFGIAVVWLIRVLRSPAPPAGGDDCRAVFAGLNKTGLKAFFLLYLVCSPLCWLPWRFVSCRPQPGGGCATRGRWIGFSPRTWFASAALALVLVAYFGSYAWLSRRGMREVEQFDTDGFFYVPLHDILATEDLTQHHRLAAFYAPANLIDQRLFRGVLVRCVIFRLSFDPTSGTPE